MSFNKSFSVLDYWWVFDYVDMAVGSECSERSSLSRIRFYFYNNHFLGPSIHPQLGIGNTYWPSRSSTVLCRFVFGHLVLMARIQWLCRHRMDRELEQMSIPLGKGRGSNVLSVGIPDKVLNEKVFHALWVVGNVKGCGLFFGTSKRKPTILSKLINNTFSALLSFPSLKKLPLNSSKSTI